MEDASIANPTLTATAPPTTHVERVLQEMTERQALYVRLLGQGWGKREAATKAGYPVRAARRPLKHIETPELKAKMQRALDRQGATMDKAARVVSEAMDATCTASFEGEVMASAHPDHKVRVQAAKVTADLMGLTQHVVAAGGGSTVTLTLAGPLAERFAQALGPKVIEGE